MTRNRIKYPTASSSEMRNGAAPFLALYSLRLAETQRLHGLKA